MAGTASTTVAWVCIFATLACGASSLSLPHADGSSNDDIMKIEKRAVSPSDILAIPITCGVITCDARIEFCNEHYAGRYPRCDKCAVRCDSLSVRTSEGRKDCYNICPTYMYITALELEASKTSVPTSQTDELTTFGHPTQIIGCAWSIGVKLPAFGAIALLIFLCVMSVIICRNQRNIIERTGQQKWVSDEYSSGTSVNSSENHKLCCMRGSPTSNSDLVYSNDSDGQNSKPSQKVSKKALRIPEASSPGEEHSLLHTMDIPLSEERQEGQINVSSHPSNSSASSDSCQNMTSTVVGASGNNSTVGTPDRMSPPTEPTHMSSCSPDRMPRDSSVPVSSSVIAADLCKGTKSPPRSPQDIYQVNPSTSSKDGQNTASACSFISDGCPTALSHSDYVTDTGRREGTKRPIQVSANDNNDPYPREINGGEHRGTRNNVPACPVMERTFNCDEHTEPKQQYDR